MSDESKDKRGIWRIFDLDGDGHLGAPEAAIWITGIVAGVGLTTWGISSGAFTLEQLATVVGLVLSGGGGLGLVVRRLGQGGQQQ